MNPDRRGPRPLSDALGELFAARGFSRLRARKELEDAWNSAVGEPACRQTRLGEVRRGVLNVTVGHSALLEELVSFRKPALLAALRGAVSGTVVHDIRFRIGPLDSEIPAPVSRPSPKPNSNSSPKSGPGSTPGSSTRRKRGGPRE